VIETQGLTFKYDNRQVLQNIDFRWGNEESILIWGPNGGGKSTFGYILCGVYEPEAGRIIWDSPPKGHVVMMMQYPSDMFLCQTVEREIAFGLENLGIPRGEIKRRVHWALETFNLERYVSVSPSCLSGGEESLVALASLVIMYPKHLILDEPFAHLDWNARKLLTDAIEEIKSNIGTTTLEFSLQPSSSLSFTKHYYLNKELATIDGFPDTYIEPISFPGEGDIICVVDEVSYQYPSRDYPAVAGINIVIREGEAIGIVGINGAGKSTLGKILSGLLKPQKGAVRTNGRIAYLFQFPERQFFKETILEDVSYGPLKLGMKEPIEQAKNALRFVGIKDELWGSSPFSLSKGILRKVALAALIATNPRLLVLDEPFAELDFEGKREMARILSRLLSLGKSYIILSCDLTQLYGFVNKLILLKGGLITWEGRIKDLPYDQKRLRSMGIVA